jgi:phosphate starvation-inducible protein PhoH and related proteins
MIKTRISIKGINPLLLYGKLDENLMILSKKYNVKIIARGENLFLQGNQENVGKLKGNLLYLIKEVKEGKTINKDNLFFNNNQNNILRSRENKKDYKANGTSRYGGDSYSQFNNSEQLVGVVTPRTPGQDIYLKALNKFDVVVCIGPAGTGKTFLAVARAVDLLKTNAVRKVILTRPAVEAGERLGFLPGDFKEKIDPYLRPLYDALYELLPREKIRQYMEEHTIEILPLGYMRGRNLDKSFIILDEAQNATKLQMKMFLTRLGIGSKACITGDITQIDLKTNEESGLPHIQQVLVNISGIKFVTLTGKDIVRHPLVKKIVEAYEIYEKENKNQ